MRSKSSRNAILSRIIGINGPNDHCAGISRSRIPESNYILWCTRDFGTYFCIESPLFMVLLSCLQIWFFLKSPVRSRAPRSRVDRHQYRYPSQDTASVLIFPGNFLQVIKIHYFYLTIPRRIIMDEERRYLEALARDDRSAFDALYLKYAAKTEEFL